MTRRRILASASVAAVAVAAGSALAVSGALGSTGSGATCTPTACFVPGSTNPIVLTPAQRARVQSRSTTQLATLVAYGRALQAEARGDAAGATQYFNDAARLDAHFVSERNQASAARAGSPASGVQRALALGVQGVNNLGPVRAPDAADAPLISSSLLTLILTIHIPP